MPLTWAFVMERMTGIEPAYSAWEADVLPLNYIRVVRHQASTLTVRDRVRPSFPRSGEPFTASGEPSGTLTVDFRRSEPHTGRASPAMKGAAMTEFDESSEDSLDVVDDYDHDILLVAGSRPEDS